MSCTGGRKHGHCGVKFGVPLQHRRNSLRHSLRLVTRTAGTGCRMAAGNTTYWNVDRAYSSIHKRGSWRSMRPIDCKYQDVLSTRFYVELPKALLSKTWPVNRGNAVKRQNCNWLLKGSSVNASCSSITRIAELVWHVKALSM